MERDEYEHGDLCGLVDDSDRHIAGLALDGDAGEIEALYASAPIDKAQSALMLCRRLGCDDHRNVDQAIALLGVVWERVETEGA